LIGTSLEVEQLDTNLFRSKILYLPTNARGVFGGLVRLGPRNRDKCRVLTIQIGNIAGIGICYQLCRSGL